MRFDSSVSRIAFVAALVACSSPETTLPDATGGQSGTGQGGATPTGGAAPTGGQGGSASGAGGTASPTGGTTSTGGVATGGASGAGAGGSTSTGGSLAGASGTSGSAGDSGGGGASGAGGDAGKGGAGGSTGGTGGGSSGAGGKGGTGGSGGKGTMATPSAGCAKGNPRPPNGTVNVANDHIYTFPASYDGRTPFPLLIGLHAAGNPINQIQNLTNGSALETSFVRAFPKSAGSAWTYNTDIAKVRAIWTDLLDNYCIDTSRVFGTGHSSGAQMLVQMLCNGETRFKAVAPVAASKYCNSFAPVAAMYIQGQMDAQRGNSNGADVVQVFRTSNMCQSTSQPKSDVMTCNSTFDRMAVTPGCITYDGCTVPTVWCSHNDNGYNSTDGHQHGWPCFATSAMAAFFQGF